MGWRQKVFDTLAAALVLLILACGAFGLGLAFYVLEMRPSRNIALGTSVAAFVLAESILRLGLPAVARQRPRPDGEDE